MTSFRLSSWLARCATPDHAWLLKRLSGNDTQANGSHQAGPYVPKAIAFHVFPSLNTQSESNPRQRFVATIDSHGCSLTPLAIYYNSRLREERSNGRDEVRLTNLGGRNSPLLDPENTGALVVLAFKMGPSPTCSIWICENSAEEDAVEEVVGPIEPGRTAIWAPGRPEISNVEHLVRRSCWLNSDEIPSTWLSSFPTAQEIVRKAVELRPLRNLLPDKRLLKRRECEYEVFRSLEEATELPRIQAGFSTVEEFASRAQSVLQRRKARSGRSLELHAREIFIEEGLQEGTLFSHCPESEPGKSPDFLFPSEVAYKDNSFPTTRLRMLAVKTTCRDRWRQILNEADRITSKHLLTLQEGISETQFREMTNARVQLVVPEPLVDKFPVSVRPLLQTLGSFILEIKELTS
jgi:hypothetical protein